MTNNNLKEIAKLVRYWLLESTSKAGSGHLTSSLSAVELMVELVFGGRLKYRIDEPAYFNNDRLIFSKGHAAPLLYALWAVAGKVTKDELMRLRQFGSSLEGHPTVRFPYTEMATGSLGQGLSVGVGMALNAKMNRLPYKTYVLLGDSEMAEGSNWEAMQLAAHYQLNNLVGIIDVNRLGQRGETMYGWDLGAYEEKCEAFGWETMTINDGHDLEEIAEAYEQILLGGPSTVENITNSRPAQDDASDLKSLSDASNERNNPVMVIARTVKGKGVSFIENQEDWHGKILKGTELEKALNELGEVDESVRGGIGEPEVMKVPHLERKEMVEIDESYDMPLATRQAYGHALVEMYPKYPEMVVLDAEVSNSTFAVQFKERYPERFIEMFIAEQNMVGVAAGLAFRGNIPFVSTFGSFFSRAVDQIRMCQYSKVNVNFVGSHVGVSIGQDGPSQMGLEDVAIFRSIIGSTVLCAADHVSEEKLVTQMVEQPGICYMRTTRMETPPIYSPNEEFMIGGSKVVKQSENDVVTVVAAGITLHEALEAYEELISKGITIRVIDLYSIKPVDVDTLVRACKATKALVVVEDHHAEGGMVEAVRSALIYEAVPIHSLAVTKIPMSGKPEELLSYEGIDARGIVEKVESIIQDL